MHKNKPHPLIIIHEPEDIWVLAFIGYLKEHNLPYQQFDLDSFAREVTILTENNKLEVKPSSPLILRPIKGLEKASDEEERFRWNESFSAIWSAAALNSFPVVNRPDEFGWGGRTSFSAEVTMLRLKSFSPGFECFWHGRAPEEKNEMFHQDLCNWSTVETPDDNSYIRSRKLPVFVGWEQVVVAGDSAYRVTTAKLEHLELEKKSLHAARSLNLQFAVISWGIHKNQNATMVRINPFPGYHECVPVWEKMCESLVQYLFS